MSVSPAQIWNNVGTISRYEMSTIEVKDCYQSKYVVTAQGISKHKSNLPKGVCGYSALFGRGMRWIERLSG